MSERVGGTSPRIIYQPDEATQSAHREAATTLLSAVWRSIDFDKWNRREIWGIFERRVKSAAVQNIGVRGFFESLKTKMKVPDLSAMLRPDDVARIVRILEMNDKGVLVELRENTALCVLRLRLEQQEKKEAFNERAV